MSDHINDSWQDYQSVRDWVNQRQDPWDAQTQWGFVVKDGVGTSAQGTFEWQRDGSVFTQTVPGQCFTGDWVPCAWGYDNKQAPIPLRQTIFGGGISFQQASLLPWPYRGGQSAQGYWDITNIQVMTFTPPPGTPPTPFTVMPGMSLAGGPRSSGPNQTVLGSNCASLAPGLAPATAIGIVRGSGQGLVYQGLQAPCDQILLQPYASGGVVPPSVLLCAISNPFFPTLIEPGTSSDLKFLSCDNTYAYAVTNNNLVIAVPLNGGPILCGAVDEHYFVGEVMVDAAGTLNVLVSDGPPEPPGLTGQQDGIGNAIASPDSVSGYSTVYMYQFRTDTTTAGTDGTGSRIMTRLNKTNVSNNYGGGEFGGFLPLGVCLGTPPTCQPGNPVPVGGIMGFTGSSGSSSGPGYNGAAILYDPNTNASMFACRNAGSAIGAFNHATQSYTWSVVGGNNTTTTAEGDNQSYETLIPLAVVNSPADLLIPSGGSPPAGSTFLVMYNHCVGNPGTLYSPFTGRTGPALPTVDESSGDNAISSMTACLDAIVSSGMGTLSVWFPISNYWGLRLYDALTGYIVADWQYPANPISVTGTQNAGDASPSGSGTVWFNGEFFASVRYASGSASGNNGDSVSSGIALSGNEYMPINTSIPAGLIVHEFGSSSFALRVFSPTTTCIADGDSVTFLTLVVNPANYTFLTDPGPLSMNAFEFCQDPGNNNILQLPVNFGGDIAGDGLPGGVPPNCHPVTGAAQQPQVIGWDNSLNPLTSSPASFGSPAIQLYSPHGGTAGFAPGGFSTAIGWGGTSNATLLQLQNTSNTFDSSGALPGFWQSTAWTFDEFQYPASVNLWESLVANAGPGSANGSSVQPNPPQIISANGSFYGVDGLGFNTTDGIHYPNPSSFWQMN